MKPHPVSEDRVLDFPVPIERRLAAARIARHGLIALSLPAALRAWSGSVLLAGENLLLPAPDEGAPRYGCCTYLVDATRGAAVAVVGCRAWSRPPLDPREPGHVVWSELEAGLCEAADRLREDARDLDGALDAARAWIRGSHRHHAPRGGSAVLASGEAILCPAGPADRGPSGAALRVLPPVQRIVIIPDSVSLVA